MVEVKDVSPYVAREMARLYPERWAYDGDRCAFTLSASPKRPDAGAADLAPGPGDAK